MSIEYEYTHVSTNGRRALVLALGMAHHTSIRAVIIGAKVAPKPRTRALADDSSMPSMHVIVISSLEKIGELPVGRRCCDATIASLCSPSSQRDVIESGCKSDEATKPTAPPASAPPASTPS